MAQDMLERLSAQFGVTLLAQGEAFGDCFITVAPQNLVAVAQHLKTSPEWAMDMPIDCTAVDYLGLRTPRFEVVLHLYSTTLRHRLRIKVPLEESNLVCPSLTPVWVGMDWHEREAWDLYGVRFEGHPDLRRVLMYEEFVGHPLRRDYPIDKRQPLVPERQVRPVPTQRHAPPELLNRP